MQYDSDRIGVLCRNSSGSVWWTSYKLQEASPSLNWTEMADGDKLSVGVTSSPSQHLVANDGGKIKYSQYYDGQWSDWLGSWGNFANTPAAMVDIDGSIHYFYNNYTESSTSNGIWHNTRIPEDNTLADADDKTRPSGLRKNYTTPEDLGGEFGSVSVLYQDEAARLDVLVVHYNGTLYHKALRDGEWASGWENLGGMFNGALAIYTRARDILIFGIGPEGKLGHGNFTPSTSFE